MPPYRTVGIHQGTSGTKPAVFGGIGPGAAPTGASAEHIALLRRAAFGLMTGRIRVPTASQGTASKAMMPRSKDAQPGLAVYTVAASPVQVDYLHFLLVAGRP